MGRSPLLILLLALTLGAQNRTYRWEKSVLVMSSLGEVVAFRSDGLEAWAALDGADTAKPLSALSAAVPSGSREWLAGHWRPAGYRSDFNKAKPNPSKFTFQAESEPGTLVTTQLLWTSPDAISIRQSVTFGPGKDGMAVGVTRGDGRARMSIWPGEPWKRDCPNGSASEARCCFCGGFRTCPTLFPFLTSEPGGWTIRLRPTQ
jgi:hypothetical protein